MWVALFRMWSSWCSVDPGTWALVSRTQSLAVLCGRHVTREVSKRRPETGGAKARESWPSHVPYYDLERWVPSNLLAMCCGRRDLGVVFEVDQSPATNQNGSFVLCDVSDCCDVKWFVKWVKLVVLCGRHVTCRALSKRRPVGPRHKNRGLPMCLMSLRGWFRPTYWLCLVGGDLGVVFEVDQSLTTNRNRSFGICCKWLCDVEWFVKWVKFVVLCGRHVTHAVSKRRPVGPRYKNCGLNMCFVALRVWFRLTYWLCLMGRDLGMVFEMDQTPAAYQNGSFGVSCKWLCDVEWYVKRV